MSENLHHLQLNLFCCSWYFLKERILILTKLQPLEYKAVSFTSEIPGVIDRLFIVEKKTFPLYKNSHCSSTKVLCLRRWYMWRAVAGTRCGGYWVTVQPKQPKEGTKEDEWMNKRVNEGVVMLPPETWLVSQKQVSESLSPPKGNDRLGQLMTARQQIVPLCFLAVMLCWEHPPATTPHPRLPSFHKPIKRQSSLSSHYISAKNGESH